MGRHGRVALLLLIVKANRIEFRSRNCVASLTTKRISLWPVVGA